MYLIVIFFVDDLNKILCNVKVEDKFWHFEQINEK